MEIEKSGNREKKVHICQWRGSLMAIIARMLYDWHCQSGIPSIAYVWQANNEKLDVKSQQWTHK